jgi:hypothetical protein
VGSWLVVVMVGALIEGTFPAGGFWRFKESMSELPCLPSGSLASVASRTRLCVSVFPCLTCPSQILDDDGSGGLSADEFCSAMKKLGAHIHVSRCSRSVGRCARTCALTTTRFAPRVARHEVRAPRTVIFSHLSIENFSLYRKVVSSVRPCWDLWGWNGIYYSRRIKTDQGLYGS